MTVSCPQPPFEEYVAMLVTSLEIRCLGCLAATVTGPSAPGHQQPAQPSPAQPSPAQPSPARRERQDFCDAGLTRGQRQHLYTLAA